MIFLKYSRQRELVLQAVCENRVHPTADFVYNKVREIDNNISLSTVYRNLNQLADSGAIKRIEVSGGADRYDGKIDEHQHIICEKCGKVVDIDIDLSDILSKVSKETEISINSVNIVFKGLCNDCRDR